MPETIAEWIVKLGLQPHPEGGYYREIYRSPVVVPAAALPDRFRGPRSLATMITYLLPGDQVSRMHRLRGDEVWHFHTGTTLSLHLFGRGEEYTRVRLGLAHHRGERLQTVVKAGCWFGATTDDPASFALVSCCVTPGFVYEDFEAGDRETMQAAWPEHRELIVRLTPRPGAERV